MSAPIRCSVEELNSLAPSDHSVTRWMLSRRELSWLARSAFVYLATWWNPGERCAWPSKLTVADALGVKRATIFEAFAELEASGHLVYRGRSGRGTVRYELVPVPSARSRTQHGQRQLVKEVCRDAGARGRKLQPGQNRPRDRDRAEICAAPPPASTGNPPSFVEISRLQTTIRPGAPIPEQGSGIPDVQTSAIADPRIGSENLRSIPLTPFLGRSDEGVAGFASLPAPDRAPREDRYQDRVSIDFTCRDVVGRLRQAAPLMDGQGHNPDAVRAAQRMVSMDAVQRYLRRGDVVGALDFMCSQLEVQNFKIGEYLARNRPAPATAPTTRTTPATPRVPEEEPRPPALWDLDADQLERMLATPAGRKMIFRTHDAHVDWFMEQPNVHVVNGGESCA